MREDSIWKDRKRFFQQKAQEKKASCCFSILTLIALVAAVIALLITTLWIFRGEPVREKDFVIPSVEEVKKIINSTGFFEDFPNRLLAEYRREFLIVVSNLNTETVNNAQNIEILQQNFVTVTGDLTLLESDIRT